MTDKLDNIKRHFDHDAAKQILTQKYESKMLFAAYGGMWKAGPDLLAITSGCQSLSEVVILDEYGNPCKVETAELHLLAYERWQEQMNAWYAEFEELQSKR